MKTLKIGCAERRFLMSVGFTLIELLVVVAIIALLVSILMPSLNVAKERAKIVLCSGNLRAIGQGFTLYGTEENGFIPRVIDAGWSSAQSMWQHRISTYVECSTTSAPIFKCPSANDWNRPSWADELNGWYLKYGMNMSISRPAMGSSPEIWGTFESCWNRVLVGDGSRSRLDGSINAWPSLLEWSQIFYPIDERHNSGSPVLYCDGHVVYVSSQNYDTLEW